MKSAVVLVITVIAIMFHPAGRAAERPHACLRDAAAHYGVDLRVVQAIAAQEAGWDGAKLYNKNGSADHGRMGINSIKFRGSEGRALNSVGIDERAVQYSGCVAYWVGTWVYATELAAAGGNVWKAVGNYHSKTPKHHFVYVESVKKRYKGLFGSIPPEAEAYRPPTAPDAAGPATAIQAECSSTETADDPFCDAWQYAMDLLSH